MNEYISYNGDGDDKETSDSYFRPEGPVDPGTFYHLVEYNPQEQSTIDFDRLFVPALIRLQPLLKRAISLEDGDVEMDCIDSLRDGGPALTIPSPEGKKKENYFSILHGEYKNDGEDYVIAGSVFNVKYLVEGPHLKTMHIEFDAFVNLGEGPRISFVNIYYDAYSPKKTQISFQTLPDHVQNHIPIDDLIDPAKVEMIETNVIVMNETREMNVEGEIPSENEREKSLGVNNNELIESTDMCLKYGLDKASELFMALEYALTPAK